MTKFLSLLISFALMFTSLAIWITLIIQGLIINMVQETCMT